MDFLLLTPHGWYFRRSVPAELRKILGRRELKQSLKTHNRAVAKDRARILLAQSSKLFEEARMNKPNFTTLKLKSAEIKPDGTIKISGLEMDPDKQEAEMVLLNKATAHLTALATSGGGATKPGSLISEAIKSFVAENGTSGNWSAKTKEEVEAALLLMLEILGDQNIDDVDRDEALRVRTILQKLPTNRSKDKLYRGKSVDQILKMNPPATPLSITSVNKVLTRSAALWHWAIQQKKAKTNPFTRMHLKKKVSARDQRHAFTTDQLELLFNNAGYKKLSGAKKWAPLIALHTGMRLNEICQMDSEDVYSTGSAWIFDVNEEGEDKKLKNLASKRLVPVHQKLIDLGFIKYVTSNRYSKKLFPELKFARDGYGQIVSKWFGRYRERVGVAERGYVFHSFRHTVADGLGQTGVPIPIIEDILGHQGKSTTTSRYMKQYAETIMLEALEKLDFSTALKNL